jgi:hypothetical protein
VHYPGHLREAFEVALAGYLYGGDSSLDGFFFDDSTQQQWGDMDTRGRLWWVAGKLWHCTDIMPSNLCDDLDMPPGATYAQACRRIRAELVAPLPSV